VFGKQCESAPPARDGVLNGVLRGRQGARSGLKCGRGRPRREALLQAVAEGMDNIHTH
jgi:hypothetical protein